MIIEWTEELAVGEAEIDSQHRELIKQMSCLWESLARGAGQEEITKVIGFLSDYVFIHFNYEENRMAAQNYPKLALHKEKHQQFFMKIEALKEQLGKDGPSQQLAIRTLHTMFQWFLSHIQRMDQEMVHFLK